MGVASGCPIAVTPIPIFDDIEGAIRMRGTGVEEIVASLSQITKEDMDKSRKEIISLRDSLQWDIIATQIQELLK